MMYRINALLSADDLAEINELLKQARFVDGRLSAGKHARLNKHNQEVSNADATLEKLNAIVMPKLITHPEYQAIALPRKIAEPYYASYCEGDYYGDHTDNPVMGQAPNLYRSDIAITIFLNHPSEYEGGELLIGTLEDDHMHTAKYPAGDAVLYTATTTHRVEPIRSGRRLVAVTWVQSLIPNPLHRELIYKLGKVQNRIRAGAPASQENRELEWLYTSLFRMWTQI